MTKEKFILFLCLLISPHVFGMDSMVDSQALTEPLSQQEQQVKYSNDTFIPSKDIDKNLYPVLQDYIKKQLIGDELKAAEEFIAALDIKIEIERIKEIYKTSDKRFLVVTAYDHRVHIINLELGQVVHIIKHADTINNVVISKNNQFLATSSKDGKAKVYFFKSGEEKIISHQSSVDSVSISNDSKFIFTFSEDKTAKVTYLLPSGKLFTITIKNDKRIVEAKITTDNRYIVMLANDGKIKVFNTTNYEKFELENNFNFVNQDDLCHIQISGDDKYLFFYYSNRIEIFDIENKTKTDEVILDEDFNILDLSSYGKYILLKGNFFADKFKLYDMQAKQFVSNGFNQNDIFVDIQGSEKLITIHNQNLHIQNLVTKHVADVQFDSNILKIKSSPDGKYLIIFTQDTKFRVYDLELDQEVYVSQVIGNNPDEDVNEMFFSGLSQSIKIFISDNSRYVIVEYRSLKKNIIIYDLQKNLELKKLEFEIWDNNPDLKIICNNKILAIINNQKRELEFFDLELNKVVFSYNQDIGIGIVDKDKYIIQHCVSASIHRIDMFDMNTYKLVYSIDNDEYWQIIYLNELLADDKNMVWYNDDGKIYIHRLDKQFLHNLTIIQLKFITWLHTQKSINKIRSEQNQEIKPVVLNQKMTAIFKSLPVYAQNALLSNYKNLEFYDNAQEMQE